MIGTMIMKRVFYAIILFFLTVLTIKAQTVDGFLRIVENTDTSYVVKLQIKIESDSATLGIASIRFKYDTTSLFFPTHPVQDKDYKMDNFNSPDYFSSVSQPSAATISINMVQMTGTGKTITTDTLSLATFHFKKLASSYSSTIYPILVQFFSPLSASQWTIGNWKNYTPTAIDNNPTVPDKFVLMQNYPNPFNPTTTIKYQIPKNSIVTLKIYNILGQEVTTLVNEMENTGNYTVQFNADKFASGTYFYRLQAGSIVETKKMLLLK